MSDPALAVEMRAIVKRFPGVVANDHVDFDVRTGEVHALLGENGAGKSTLMNILAGLYSADEGKIQVRGESVSFTSPSDAIDVGLGMVHQHFTLVDSLTVTENILLGLERATLLAGHAGPTKPRSRRWPTRPASTSTLPPRSGNYRSVSSSASRS